MVQNTHSEQISGLTPGSGQSSDSRTLAVVAVVVAADAGIASENDEKARQGPGFG